MPAVPDDQAVSSPAPSTSNTNTSTSTSTAPKYRRSGAQGLGASSGPIARIGAAVSLSGSMKMFGATQRNGIKLAQDEINASGVLGATRLEVIVDDDGSDRQQAAAVFQRFIDNSHVLGIIGPTQSDVALSVDPLAQQAGVPVLAISNPAGGITQIGNFIFRSCLSEAQLTPQIIKAVRSRVKLHSAALLYSDTDPGRAGAHGFKAALQQMGVRITAEQVFTADQTEFSPQLDEIASSPPDVLFINAPPHAAAELLIQARRHGLSDVPIVGNSAFNSSTVLRAAGDAAEGLIVGSGWSLANPLPRNQQFIASYRQRYGTDPDQFAAQAYTGVYVMAEAVRQARTATDPRAVRDALEHISQLDTPVGQFSFDDLHDARYAAFVQIARRGQFEQL
jgi:branched-chain amino acid transport system substrate-binding protein